MADGSLKLHKRSVSLDSKRYAIMKTVQKSRNKVGVSCMVAHSHVGELLRKARLDKGYSLGEVQQITKIKYRYLVAIEEGNTETLPGRSAREEFLRKYADAVGVSDPEVRRRVPENRPTSRTEMRQSQKRQYRGGTLYSLPPSLYLVLILLVLGIIWYLKYIK